MTEPAILQMKDMRVGFGGKPLFTGLELTLHPRDHYCLIGRNGCGKSTLLKLLFGMIEPDEGTMFLLPGTRLAYLPQNIILKKDETVGQYILSGLPETERQHGEDLSYRADEMADMLQLNPRQMLSTLSGGMLRRSALARTLIDPAEILLLDEPTNHLDMPTIEWLEKFLKSRRSTFITISHDRQFLKNVSQRTLWLDRGKLYDLSFGYSKFDDWLPEFYPAEEKRLQRLDTQISQELHWLARGVTARRKRNQGRLRKLEGMRALRAQHIAAKSTLTLPPVDAANSSKVVVEMFDVSKSYQTTDGKTNTIIKPFSCRVLRGDRIGLIGPNGAGKSTLIKMLIGELKPDQGRVRLGKTLEVAYFSQGADNLDPNKTLWQTLCPDGGDHVVLQGRPRHVVAYLKDFLFDPKQAHAPVGTLSGGERNRLQLSRILLQPSSLLVLDEPTNDLDVDTLDLLQDLLDDYAGTVIVASHDRDFLDRIVTSIIAFEGQGKISEYAGGYSDYVKQSSRSQAASDGSPNKPITTKTKKPQPNAQVTPKPKEGRLSFNQRHALKMLPVRISELQSLIDQAETKLSDSDLYAKDAKGFEKYSADLIAYRQELERCEIEWLDLAALAESLGESVDA